MSIGHQPSAPEILHWPTNGWRALHSSFPREFMGALRSKLHGHTEEKEVGDNMARFVLELTKVRLQGATHLGCLVLGGVGSGADALVRQLLEKHGGPGRLVLIFTASKPAEEAARRVSPRNRSVVFSMEETNSLLSADRPLEVFKRKLRCDVQIERLNPFNITLPVEPGMFFGRRWELNKLHYEERVSFAIAGPGRIGKTSLLRQYQHELIRNHDPRTHHLHLINFYELRNVPTEDLPRTIALRVSSSSRSDRTNLSNFKQFIEQQAKESGAQLELLLDEVDEVCMTEPFKLLAEAAKEGFCRLLLCGKGVLLKMMTSSSSAPLAQRLVLLRPEPLDRETTGALLLEPLADLGFTVESPSELKEQVHRLTSGLPHLIQNCGSLLVDVALKQRTRTITLGHLETAREDYLNFIYGLGPLQDLSDNLCRLAAVLLLQLSPPEVTVPLVLELLKEEGFSIEPRKAVEVCNDLVVCNILIWKRDSYRIANQDMGAYAEKIGLLDPELRRLRAVLGAGKASDSNIAI